MGNATDCISQRSTFFLSPFFLPQLHTCKTEQLTLRPIHIAPTGLRIASAVQFSAGDENRPSGEPQCYKQDLYRQPTLLMMMRITPPARSG